MPNKPFFTYEQQIKKLTKEKQLVISDTEFAKDTLQKLSYFSLIGGYKDLFKHKPSGKYLRGVTFEEITAFYYFDEELRTLFLKYILHVERQLKSMLSYYFCEKYGEQQSAYLDMNKVTSPHFKWGFDFCPSRAFYWFRQRRDFAVPLLLVPLPCRARYFLPSSNLSFSSCS